MRKKFPVSAGSCIDCPMSQSRDRGGANTTARATELSGFGLILVLICPVINTRVRFPSPPPLKINDLQSSAVNWRNLVALSLGHSQKIPNDLERRRLRHSGRSGINNPEGTMHAHCQTCIRLVRHVRAAKRSKAEPRRQ